MRTINLSNLMDRIFKAREQYKNKRNVTSTNLDESNIIEKKRIRFASKRYSLSDYAQLAWIEEEWDKFSEFHVTFMIELMKINHFDENENYLHIDLKIESSNQNQESIHHININISNCIHINTLLSSSTHWRAMLRHSHDEKFKQVAQIKFDAINSKST